MRVLLFGLALLQSACAVTLYEALSRVPELSNFTAFYSNNEVFATAYFGNTSAYPITFLAPNNDAFAKLQEVYGEGLTNIPTETLLSLVQYHTLVSNLTSEDFDNGGDNGATIPTMLNNNVTNNRSVGVAMASKFGGAAKASGQVVFIKNADSGTPGRFKLMARENSAQPPSSIRSGLSSNVGIKALDGEEGVWDGGRFHIVDGLLTPPDLCTKTIRGAGLGSLDNALNRTDLWPALDGHPNVTCLGPNDAAFGGADISLNTTVLTDALLFHTLGEVAYSDYLYDGQEFKSLQNGTVRVAVSGTGAGRQIWFNNAKVIDANVLTHNGLVHILDAVMVPLEQMNTTNTTRPGVSPTSSGTSPTKTNAATPLVVASSINWALAAMLASCLLLI